MDFHSEYPCPPMYGDIRSTTGQLCPLGLGTGLLASSRVGIRSISAPSAVEMSAVRLFRVPYWQLCPRRVRLADPPSTPTRAIELDTLAPRGQKINQDCRNRNGERLIIRLENDDIESSQPQSKTCISRDVLRFQISDMTRGLAEGWKSMRVWLFPHDFLAFF